VTHGHLRPDLSTGFAPARRESERFMTCARPSATNAAPLRSCGGRC
jgi:hypothetical protein